MNWTFESLETPELICVVCSGLFTSADFATMFDELLVLPYWHKLVPIFLDQKNLEVAETSWKELMDASDTFIRHNSNFAYTKISILFGSQESYETGLRFAAITKQGTKALVRMFRDEQKALDWVAPEAKQFAQTAGRGPRIH